MNKYNRAKALLLELDAIKSGDFETNSNMYILLCVVLEDAKQLADSVLEEQEDHKWNK